MRFEDLDGCAVVIWGAGREGMAAHAELARRGVDARIAVTGSDSAPDRVATGGAALALLDGADAIVKSPGIPHTSPEYARLRDRGARITSLMDLWLNENRDRVVGVTGTKGKSTTSALAHHVLTSVGLTAELVGNIGVPVGRPVKTDAAVAEVSSYQAAEITASPRVAVVTSIYAEHLPWHGGFDAYVADKLRLTAFGPQAIVVPDLSGEVARRVRDAAGDDAPLVSPASFGLAIAGETLTWQGAGELRLADIALNGTHNLANAALALTAVAAFTGSVDRAGALAAVASFGPLAHRLETIPSHDGRVWVDDGLATAPQAVAAALASMPNTRIVLIAGGSERDVPFTPLVDALAARADVDVVCTGPAGSRLAREAHGNVARIHVVDGFSRAVERARALAEPGSTILLSPGAPSFDEFADYAARSAAFRRAAED